MNVRMMGERLSPGMKNGEESDLAAEVLGIGGDDLERCGNGIEQDGIDDRLVVEGDLGDVGRHREHDVEVGHRRNCQNFCV